MKNNTFKKIGILSALLLFSCTQNEDVTNSDEFAGLSLKTNDITDITQQSAVFTGEFLSLGEIDTNKYAAFDVGFCVSITNSTPSMSDDNSFFISASDVKDLTDKMFEIAYSPLVYNTEYYVRAAIMIKEQERSDAKYFYANETKSFKTLDLNSTTEIIPSEINLTLLDQTTESVKLNLSIGNNSNVSILNKGVCISTNPNPTVADLKSEVEGPESDNFEINFNDLLPNTIYYIRPYVTNFYVYDSGISEEEITELTYGPEITINTEIIIPPSETGTFTDPRDGNTYKWVKIGNQIWMAENLRYIPKLGTTYIPTSGNTPVLADNSAINNPDYIKYGVLYPKDGSTKIVGIHMQTQDENVAPDGWHIPSESEWNVLIEKLGGKDYAGIYLKKTAESLEWNQGIDLQKSNALGFNALPAGKVFIDVYDNRYGNPTYISTYKITPNVNYCQFLTYENLSISLNHNDNEIKPYILNEYLRLNSYFSYSSIRCVRD